jgi:hypothetical protein
MEQQPRFPVDLFAVRCQKGLLALSVRKHCTMMATLLLFREGGRHRQAMKQWFFVSLLGNASTSASEQQRSVSVGSWGGFLTTQNFWRISRVGRKVPCQLFIKSTIQLFLKLRLSSWGFHA